MERQPSGIAARFRNLMVFQGETLGFPIVLACVVIVIAIAGWITLPTGPTTLATGRITGMGLVERDEGSFTSASISVDDRNVRVRLPNRHGCRTGDDIRLFERRTRWGTRTTVELTRWPCTRAEPLSATSTVTYIGV